jgi:hypothetical protein
MPGVKAVAERMGDNIVSHNPTVPGLGKTTQAVDAAGCLEHSLLIAMMTIPALLDKAIKSEVGRSQSLLTRCRLSRMSAYRAHISHCYPVLSQVTLPVHANVTNASDFSRQVPP